MTEAILGVVNSQRIGLKEIEKMVKEIEEKHKEEMRANILEASNQLCVEFKSLQREDVRVRRIIARVFGDDKCIGKRKNGRPCGNKSMTGLDGYCKTCYKSKPPESTTAYEAVLQWTVNRHNRVDVPVIFDGGCKY